MQSTAETPYYEKPMAAKNVPGLKSYRYKGAMNWIMIGAFDDDDAAREAQRSSSATIDRAKLDRWDGTKYVPVQPVAA